MEDTLEAIQFIANSANRMRVLDALTAEPRARREIEPETGVSRSTVSRTLDRCGNRGWVASEGSRYWITPLGREMTSAFRAFLETTEGIQHLGEAVRWLPEPVRSIDFRHFRDAVIVTPEPTNPSAPFDHGLERILEADTYRALTSTALPRYVEAVRDAVAAGELEVASVHPVGFFERIADDSTRLEPWRNLEAHVRVYRGRVPIDFHITDDLVLIWLGGVVDGDLEVYGLMESDEPAVLAWAESLYEEYRDQAEPLDIDLLVGE